VLEPVALSTGQRARVECGSIELRLVFLFLRPAASAAIMMKPRDPVSS
jgi:hypothetical protein